MSNVYTKYSSLYVRPFHVFYVTDMRYDTISVSFIKSCL